MSVKIDRLERKVEEKDRHIAELIVGKSALLEAAKAALEHLKNSTCHHDFGAVSALPIGMLIIQLRSAIEQAEGVEHE